MFLTEISDIPKSLWIVTVVTVNVQPTYTTLNTMAVDCENTEEALHILNDWKDRYCIVYQEITQVHLDTNSDFIREEAIRALKKKKSEILAERQHELDEVDEAIQNLLALPAPGADHEG